MVIIVYTMIDAGAKIDYTYESSVPARVRVWVLLSIRALAGILEPAM